MGLRHPVDGSITYTYTYAKISTKQYVEKDLKKYICGEKRTYVEQESQINRFKKKTH